MHVELARARSPRDVHRVVIVHRHVQDRTDIVHIPFRECAPSTRNERLERDDQRAFLEVEEFRPDCLVDCFFFFFLRRLVLKPFEGARRGKLTFLAEHLVVHEYDVCTCH
jgi:hypothetical protein